MKNKIILCIVSILILINTVGCAYLSPDYEPSNTISVRISVSFNDGINISPDIRFTHKISEKPAEPEINYEEEARQYNSTRRVICYGDSLMEGTGGEGVTIPNTLEDISGAEVLNYGVYADTASAVSARMGANPQYLVEDIVIPADSTPVKAQCSGKYGYEMLLNFGDAGVNNVFIDGIEGTYFITGEGDRMFSRLEPGEETFVKEGTQLITHAIIDKRPDDIIVLWAGANDSPQTTDEIQPVIDKLNEMIEYLGTDEYIVLNDISDFSRTPVVSEINDRLSSEYGEHYLDIRDYLVNHALDDLNIEATDTDKEKISNGELPPSILADEIHGTSDYYRLVGEQVYKKLVDLGYLK